jgi:hypothetical protein
MQMSAQSRIKNKNLLLVVAWAWLLLGIVSLGLLLYQLPRFLQNSEFPVFNFSSAFLFALGGWGLLHLRNWARMLIIWLSILLAINAIASFSSSIGALSALILCVIFFKVVLSVYSFWVLSLSDVKVAFRFDKTDRKTDAVMLIGLLVLFIIIFGTVFLFFSGSF